MSDIATIRREARLAVHSAFATPALYQDETLAEPVEVAVRWHNRATTLGDLDGGGYAEVVARIDRVIFDREALAELPVTPRRGGTLTLTDHDDLVLKLDSKDPHDGPVTETWTVTRP